jgi:hypothetical protein
MYHIYMDDFEMTLASIQEGEEWISRLEQEADKLRLDIVAATPVLSSVGVGALEYHLQKTEEAIESIRFEIIAIGMGLGDE